MDVLWIARDCGFVSLQFGSFFHYLLVLVGEFGLHPCDFGLDVFEVARQVVLYVLVIEVPVSVSFLLGKGLVVECVKGGHGENPAVADVGDNPALGGAGENPTLGGVGENSALGGAGENPTLGGVGESPALGGVGENPALGGAGENPTLGSVGESETVD